MAEQSEQNRTEEATPRRRERAREEGDVVTSPDLSAGLILAVVCLLALLFQSSFLSTLKWPLIETLGGLKRMEWGVSETVAATSWLLVQLWIIAGTVGVITFGTALISSQWQSGISIRWSVLRVRWDKVSPATGWGRLFSMESGVRGAFAVLKIGSTGCVILAFVWWRHNDIRMGGGGTAIPRLEFALSLMSELGVGLAFVTLAWGVCDYAFKWFRHEHKLKMSKQEIKDEQKDDQGDPLIRARMRRLQKELAARQRTLRDVPDATLVLTNPTHYAVAIKYETGRMSAPVIIAKGTDAFARQISEAARRSGVPVLERKPLTRALYAMADVGDEIPFEFYRVIAELLAHLYRMKNAA